MEAENTFPDDDQGTTLTDLGAVLPPDLLELVVGPSVEDVFGLNHEEAWLSLLTNISI